MTDTEIQTKIDARIAEFSRNICERVQLGELTDIEANALAADFADRMYREGPWS